MNYKLREAISQWDNEVDAEALRLIESGTPPYDAIEQAVKIISRCRAGVRKEGTER